MSFIRSGIHVIKKLYWWAMYARMFKKYSFTSTVLPPLNLQGHKYITIGENVYVHRSVWLAAYELPGTVPELIISDGACLGNFNHIACAGSICIGKKVLTADNVFISDHLHDYNDPLIPIMDQPIFFKKKVTIGDGAWIGQNVCIIGACVGKNSVIGANSVVTRDIPDYCVAAGAPAKIIKRFDFHSGTWKPEIYSSLDTI